MLVATDFSPSSDRAVEEGFDLASRFGAQVHLVHVVAGPLHEMWAGYVPADDFVGVVKTHKAEARRKLEAIAAKHTAQECPATIVTPYGLPVDELVDYARVHDIDLIICGTHSRRGLDRLVMGSIAEKLVQLAPCPVLTVSGRAVEPAAA